MQALLLEYTHRNSPLHHMDPRWKLAAIVLGSVSVVLLQSLAGAGLAFVGSLLLFAVSRLPWRWFFLRLGGVAIFLAIFLFVLPLTMPGEDVSLGFLTLSAAGMELAVLIILKALTIVVLVLLLVATSPLEMTLKAAHALHFPSLVVQLLMLTYRYVFLFWDELDKLRIALRLRRYRNRASRHSYHTIGNVTGTLLVRSYERAERVGHAMRCRGYAGQFQSLQQFHTRCADIWKFTAMLLLLGAVPWGMELLRNQS